jgi:hypothetical protein
VIQQKLQFSNRAGNLLETILILSHPLIKFILLPIKGRYHGIVAPLEHSQFSAVFFDPFFDGLDHVRPM